LKVIYKLNGTENCSLSSVVKQEVAGSPRESNFHPFTSRSSEL